MANPATPAEWDEAFRSGRRAFLHDVDEAARTGILAAWLNTCDCGQRVLDIGCGEAILLRHLDRAALEAYVGVDLSAVALSGAAADRSVARLVEADLRSFAPEAGERFSAIVFNEVLYYVDDPAHELRRSADWLAPGGVIAISNYTPWKETGGGVARVEAVERETDGPAWEVLDAVEVTSAVKKVRWRLRLVRPRG